MIDSFLEIDEHLLRSFKILDILGQGAYGVVWKALEVASSQTIALKKVHPLYTISTLL